MMKTKINIFFIKIIVLTVYIGLSSCSSFLREHSDDLSYIKSLEDLDQLLIGSAYMNVAPRTPLDYESFYIPFIHYMSDETEEIIGVTRYNPEANIRPRIFGYFTWQKSVGTSFDGMRHYNESVDWLRFYNHISTTNIILEEVDKIEVKTMSETSQKNRIKAEASFLRAAYYFLLVNLYAEPYCENNLSKSGVPLKVNNYIEDKKFTRQTIDEVYSLILSDLENARNLMSGITQTSKYRISEAGIYLFLSRVNLYMQNWQKAAEFAKKSIEMKSSLENLNGWSSNNFIQNIESNEILFSMGGSLLYSHLFSSCPTGCFQVSRELYDSFTESDLRKNIYFKMDKTSCSLSGHYIYPIKQNPKGPYRSDVSEIFCLRSAEAYMNLAEAEAFLNNPQKSLLALNILLKTRINNSSYQPVNINNQEALVTFIRNERRKELCFEGHRWFDLRRYRVTKHFPYKKNLKNTYTIYNKVGNTNTMVATYEYLLPAAEDNGYVLPIPIEEKRRNDIIDDNIRIDREPFNIQMYE